MSGTRSCQMKYCTPGTIGIGVSLIVQSIISNERGKRRRERSNIVMIYDERSQRSRKPPIATGDDSPGHHREISDYVLNILQHRDELSRLKPIVKYWLDHLDDDVTIETIASELGLDSEDAGFQETFRQAQAFLHDNIKAWYQQRWLREMLKCVAKDDEVDVLRHLWRHPEQNKPRHWEAALNIPVKQGQNVIRRLRRNTCLQKLQDELL